MFFGRERELGTLNKLYNSDHFEFLVLYGRRRVGKTALIRHFIKGKRAVYCMGVESSERQNLENLSRSILEFSNQIQMDGTFDSFQAALEYMFRLSENKRIILAIDEYPYIARISKSLASTLQLLIDQYKDHSKLMLILCGSSMSYMEDHVLSYKAPLYGRRTAQLKLQPFSFKETIHYTEAFSNEDKALIYGIVGGTPQYLLQIDPALSLRENIINIYLDPISPLFEEPVNLLKQEVREPGTYNAVITAIAKGASRLSEISGKSGTDANVCAVYLKNLISLGIVQREIPYGETISKKAIYSISDNMFRFWYRFVPDNASMITLGIGAQVYKRIEPFLSEYMGKVFEDICREYLWDLMREGRSPVDFTSLGRWWGNDPIRKKQAEIDIMGEQDKDTALFAECKWTNEKVDQSVLDTLIDRSRLFSYKDPYYFLFAKNGFTKGCEELAEQLGNVMLVSFEAMITENWHA